MERYYFTSESVTEGHPDKVCDRVSDAVVDALIAKDPFSRSACEAAVKDNELWIFGEVSSSAAVDYEEVARCAIADIGYTGAQEFSAETCGVEVALREQSPDIALGVDNALEAKQGGERQLGAGDQGMMFGFACDETPELMPLPISLAHRLCRALAAARKSGEITCLRPDGKAQVTVEYEGGRPLRIEAVVVSAQHSPDVGMGELRELIKEKIILGSLPPEMIDGETKFFINPTGRFVTGGPAGDSGLTGRKIIVDTYGGYSRHGGGCFSGKDPTKVDRSGAYMARYVAKNIVAAGLAAKCEVQLAYAIGVANPVSVFVETFGTERAERGRIARAAAEYFDLCPAAIIERLDLLRPIYTPLSAYGHIGREELGVAWERADAAGGLRDMVLGSGLATV
jgi:S-adenosylmethionine synthetase